MANKMANKMDTVSAITLINERLNRLEHATQNPNQENIAVNGMKLQRGSIERKITMMASGIETLNCI